MKKDNVVTFENPAEFKHDLLTEVIRQGAHQLLAAAVNAEVEELLASSADRQTPDSKSRFARNGYLPERNIQTGVGEIAVKVARVRDRAFVKDGIKFGSSIIPRYLRRSGDMNELLPLLYLKGLSTNDFAEALAPLFGNKAKEISPGVISRLKSKWETEYQDWRKRDLTGQHYVYWWAEGTLTSASTDE